MPGKNDNKASRDLRVSKSLDYLTEGASLRQNRIPWMDWNPKDDRDDTTSLDGISSFNKKKDRVKMLHVRALLATHQRSSGSETLCSLVEAEEEASKLWSEVFEEEEEEREGMPYRSRPTEHSESLEMGSTGSPLNSPSTTGEDDSEDTTDIESPISDGWGSLESLLNAVGHQNDDPALPVVPPPTRDFGTQTHENERPIYSSREQSPDVICTCRHIRGSNFYCAGGERATPRPFVFRTLRRVRSMNRGSMPLNAVRVQHNPVRVQYNPVRINFGGISWRPCVGYTSGRRVRMAHRATM